MYQCCLKRKISSSGWNDNKMQLEYSLPWRSNCGDHSNRSSRDGHCWSMNSFQLVKYLTRLNMWWRQPQWRKAFLWNSVDVLALGSICCTSNHVPDGSRCFFFFSPSLFICCHDALSPCSLGGLSDLFFLLVSSRFRSNLSNIFQFSPANCRNSYIASLVDSYLVKSACIVLTLV